MAYRYESEWAPYAFPQERDHIATNEELQEKLSAVKFNQKNYAGGGIPLISDGVNGYLLDNDQMTLVYGKTGSGKTRSLVVPLICTLAKAGESMIVFDQKGDFSTGIYSSYVRGTLDKQGYKTIILDFKGLAGDGLNLLGKVMAAAAAKDRDRVDMEIDIMASALRKNADKKDPKSGFWNSMGATYFSCIVKLLLAAKRHDGDVNFQSIYSFCEYSSAEKLRKLMDFLPLNEVDKNKLKSVVCLHQSGITSVMGSIADPLSIYSHNIPLLKMCSHDTFEVADLYKRKTAVIICVPDATSAYDEIAAAMLSNILAELVEYTAKAPDNKLPRRVNVVADEFANYRIPDFERRISTDRSKNIRYYLFLQGQDQLRKSYPEAASTIIANCTNVFFLSSAEIELMENLSALSGISKDNLQQCKEPLVSVSDLQSLKQTSEGRECYFTDGPNRFFTVLPDISCYKAFANKNQSYTVQSNPPLEAKRLQLYTIDTLIRSLKERHGSRTIDEALEKDL